MKTVTIYTDGACSGNPGPGGWGAVLRYGAHERELSGGEAQTTNNRMELTAVIEALRLLKEPCEVELYSDSKYVIDALSKGWVYGWQKKGGLPRKPVNANSLARQLLRMAGTRRLNGADMKNVTIYTDGACSGNPGPGAGAAPDTGRTSASSPAARRRPPTTAWSLPPSSRLCAFEGAVRGRAVLIPSTSSTR